MYLSCGFCSEYEACQARKEAAAVLTCSEDGGTERDFCLVVEKKPDAEACSR